MALLRVPTNFNIDLEFESPEFHKRLLAVVFDFILQFFYIKIAVEIYSSMENRKFTEDVWYDMMFMWIIILTPAFLYPLICEMTMNGQTIGKKLMKIQVVNENGGKASFSQLMIRFLLNPVNYMLLAIFMYRPFFLAAAVAIVVDIVLSVATKKYQRFGEILAHTILISTNAKGSVQDTVFMEVSENYVPMYPQIMQLSDKDINAIKGILDTAVKKGDFGLAAMAAEKIKGHLKIESSLSPFEFLEVVMKDYNYLSTR